MDILQEQNEKNKKIKQKKQTKQKNIKKDISEGFPLLEKGYKMDVARRRRQAAKGVWAVLKENQPAAGIKSFQTCVNAYFLKLWIKYLVRNQNGMWNNVKENKKNKEKKQKKQFISSCHFNFFSFIFYLLGYQKTQNLILVKQDYQN